MKVRIEYNGHYASKAGKLAEMIETSSDLVQAYHEIVQYFLDAYAITPPFILMLGNKHIEGAIRQRKEVPLNSDDVFKLIPFLSGG